MNPLEIWGGNNYRDRVKEGERRKGKEGREEGEEGRGGMHGRREQGKEGGHNIVLAQD